MSNRGRVLKNSPEEIDSNRNVEGYVSPENGNQYAKQSVVPSANAVVEPVTMMVELFTTTITLTTMFGLAVYKACANRASKLVFVFIFKRLFFRSKSQLEMHQRICRV